MEREIIGIAFHTNGMDEIVYIDGRLFHKKPGWYQPLAPGEADKETDFLRRILTPENIKYCDVKIIYMDREEELDPSDIGRIRKTFPELFPDEVESEK